ncbi:MAG: hypothetical protein VR67_18655 [Peptococcaceae bacterium BRH_c8a]|nr:MAG: hypothetical protein VR67_18655 [Peptococcaceae bacterium BRH_c8a]
MAFLVLDIRANPDMDLNWSVLSLGLALLGLLGFFLKFESSGPSAGEVALLATMSALAALGRLPFAAIPNVQPTTFLVIISGYVLGPGAGFAVGALAALTSNFFLGLGPWTPWQMVAWGLVGLSAGVLARIKSSHSRWALVAFALGWGYLYGLIMNTWHWLTYIYPLSWQTFAATYAAGFAFDTLHAVGNGVFMYLMGMEMIKILQRFGNRLTVKTIEVKESVVRSQ